MAFFQWRRVCSGFVLALFTATESTVLFREIFDVFNRLTNHFHLDDNPLLFVPGRKRTLLHVDAFESPIVNSNDLVAAMHGSVSALLWQLRKASLGDKWGYFTKEKSCFRSKILFTSEHYPWNTWKNEIKTTISNLQSQGGQFILHGSAPMSLWTYLGNSLVHPNRNYVVLNSKMLPVSCPPCMSNPHLFEITTTSKPENYKDVLLWISFNPKYQLSEEDICNIKKLISCSDQCGVIRLVVNSDQQKEIIKEDMPTIKAELRQRLLQIKRDFPQANRIVILSSEVDAVNFLTGTLLDQDIGLKFICVEKVKGKYELSISE